MARIDELKERHANNPMLQYVLQRREEMGTVDRHAILTEKAANNPRLAYMLKRAESVPDHLKP